MQHLKSFRSSFTAPARQRLFLACLWLLSVSLLLSLCTVPPAAVAQTPPASSLSLEQKAELDALFKDAYDAYTQRDYQAAIAHFQKGLKRAEEMKAPLYIGAFLNGLGVVYSGLRQSDRALDFYNRALDLYRKNNASPPDITGTLNNLGNLYQSLGQNEEAFDVYNQALELDRQTNASPLEIADTLNALGNASLDLGQNDKALDLYNQALELNRKNNANPSDIADTLNNLGLVYQSLGQNDRSLDFYNQALELVRKSLANSLEIASILNNIGGVFYSLGQNEEALDLYNQTLELKRKNNASPLTIASTLNNLGLVYTALGQNDKALDLYNQALELNRKNNANPKIIATNLRNMGVVYNALGQNDKALALYNQALELNRKNNANTLDIAQTLNKVGYTLRLLNRLNEAGKQFAECLRLRESLSYQVGNPLEAGAFQETFGWFYEGYARLLLDQKRPEDALEMLERGRAQGLRQLLLINLSGGVSHFLTPTEQKAFHKATEDLNVASRLKQTAVEQLAFSSPDNKPFFAMQIEERDARLLQAQQQYTALYEQIFRNHKELNQLAANESVRKAQLLKLVHDSKDTLYLDYGFVDNKAALLFALGDKDNLKSFALSLDYQRLVTAVQNWRGALEEVGGKRSKADDTSHQAKTAGEEKALAQQIYKLLLGEAEKAGLLAGGRYKHLVIVGSGPLLIIPLAALCDAQGKRLIERYSVSRSLALSVSFWSKNPLRSKSSLLCIADPTGGAERQAKQGGQDNSDKKFAASSPPAVPSLFRSGFKSLPGARNEGHAVADLYPDAKLLVGPAAREKDILKLLPDYDLLHFATHGFLVPNAIQNSGLVLAEEPPDSPNDGMLSARKILGLPLSARLAVLSACETGRGLSKGGEGLMGLAWAFRASGVPAVVASQWQVDDAATKQLMVAFYTGIKAGKPKDEALRDAMLAVQKVHPSPFYWAAFELIGETGPLK